MAWPGAPAGTVTAAAFLWSSEGTDSFSPSLTYATPSPICRAPWWIGSNSSALSEKNDDEHEFLWSLAAAAAAADDEPTDTLR